MSDTVVVLADEASLADDFPQPYRVRFPGSDWNAAQAKHLATERVREHYRQGGRGSLLNAPRGELIVAGIEKVEERQEGDPILYVN